MAEPVRVLFVDDEVELVSAVVERLGLRGIVAEGVTSGAEALSRVETEPFDVLVVDVRMPGIGGLDVVQKVKQSHPRIEVVLVSGHGSLQDAEAGMAMGAFDYLQKPVEIDALLDVIQRAAEKTRGEVLSGLSTRQH
jgi:DNA-binding NtrC family response regulator